MKYKYYDKGNKFIAESDSPIMFNVARFAIWKGLKPVIEEEKKVTKKEATNEVAKDEVVKETTYKPKKRKKTEEDS